MRYLWLTNRVQTTPRRLPLIALGPLGLLLAPPVWADEISESVIEASRWAIVHVPGCKKLRKFGTRGFHYDAYLDPESVAYLKILGVNSLVFDPAGNVTVKGNFLSVMQQNVENLKLAF